MKNYYAVNKNLFYTYPQESISEAEIQQAFSVCPAAKKSATSPYIFLFTKKSDAIAYIESLKTSKSVSSTPIFKIALPDNLIKQNNNSSSDAPFIKPNATAKEFKSIKITNFYLTDYSIDKGEKFHLPTLNQKAKWDGFSLPPIWVIIFSWTIVVPLAYVIYHTRERTIATERLTAINNHTYQNWINAGENLLSQPDETTEPGLGAKRGTQYNTALLSQRSDKTLNKKQPTEEELAAEKSATEKLVAEALNKKQTEADDLIKELDLGASKLDGLPLRIINNSTCDFKRTLESCKADLSKHKQQMPAWEKLEKTLEDLKTLAHSTPVIQRRNLEALREEESNKQQQIKQEERDQKTGGVHHYLGGGDNGMND